MFKDSVIIISIVLALCFFAILICNNKFKSKVVKFSFLILSLFYLGSILLFDSSYVHELLKSLITYIWYPNYLIFVCVILISIFILIYTLLKKKMDLKIKIMNYFIFCLDFVCYITFIRLKIDVTSYSSLYSLKSLVIMRIVTISFLIWVIVRLVLKGIKRGKNEK